MQKAVLLTFAIVAGCFSNVIGQEISQIKKIRKLTDKNQYVQAWKIIEPLLSIHTENDELNFFAGLSKLKMYQQEEALTFMLKARPVSHEKYHYYLAETYFQNDLIEQAKEAADHIRIESLTEEEHSKMMDHFHAYDVLKNTQTKVYVKNMGPKINSEAHEYNGVMTADQKSVVYTSRRNETKNETGDGFSYEEIYETKLDENQEWISPQKFEINSAKSHHNATVAIFDNDSKMITYKDEDLFISEWENDTWSEPLSLDIINGSGSAETHCFINDSFDTIFYATDYYSIDGNLDLYMIVNEAGEWTSPQALNALNTPYNDDAPFMAKNGDFYFSSQGHNSMGGYDIFKTKFNDELGDWEMPSNMGYLINSPSDDIYFNTFGKIAYLSSGRKGGFGNLDIYRVFLFNKINIQGQVIDQQSGKALSGARINVKGTENDQVVSDRLGFYSIEIPIETVFEMNIEYENQLIYEGEHFAKVLFSDQNDNVVHLSVDISGEHLGDKNEPKEIAIKMVNDFDINPVKIVPADTENNLLTLEIYGKKEESIAIQEAIEIPIIYFDFNKTELLHKDKAALLKLAKYLHNEPHKALQVIGHTDLPGADGYNKTLGEKRAMEVKNFLIQLGIQEERLVVGSMGEHNPLINTETKNELNRRAELEILDLENNQEQNIATTRNSLQK